MSAKASEALNRARFCLSKAILEVKMAEDEVFEVRGLHSIHVGLRLLRATLGEWQQRLLKAETTPNLRTRSETPEEGP